MLRHGLGPLSVAVGFGQHASAGQVQLAGGPWVPAGSGPLTPAQRNDLDVTQAACSQRFLLAGVRVLIDGGL